MSPYTSFVVQPLPFSRSLLYPLLTKNINFLQWYQTHRNFDETYRNSLGSPYFSYVYSYRYETQTLLRDLHINPVIDTITCNLLVSHDKRVYNESLIHKVYYVPKVSSRLIRYSYRDYIIHTEHTIQLDGNLIQYDDIDTAFINKLHL